jgi:hypothetical protein
MPIDKKALIRAYKVTPRTMGVGAVRNTGTGRAFVFSGVDLPSLLNRHRTQLKFGGHPNKALQQDWNTLGEGAFAFEVLDTLKPSDAPGYDPADDLKALENLWMEKLQPWEATGYHRPPRPAP